MLYLWWLREGGKGREFGSTWQRGWQLNSRPGAACVHVSAGLTSWGRNVNSGVDARRENFSGGGTARR